MPEVRSGPTADPNCSSPSSSAAAENGFATYGAATSSNPDGTYRYNGLRTVVIESAGEPGISQ